MGPVMGIQLVQPGLVMALGASFQMTGVPSGPPGVVAGQSRASQPGSLVSGPSARQWVSAMYWLGSSSVEELAGPLRLGLDVPVEGSNTQRDPTSIVPAALLVDAQSSAA
ncbi:hypothetical protein CVCC1112_4417 [Paenarthrobacter nicotinovorans]|nr:hypothetical protein CVCC1112_4417 [Paenarthrobacter nicotinovorans]